MTRLLLVRHGATEWNEKGRFQGQSDIRLSSEGIAQSLTLAQSLCNESISAVYSSDLLRASCTARNVANQLGLEVNEDKRLREINLGVWEGLDIVTIQERYPGELERRNDSPCVYAPEGGETLVEVASRTVPAIREIASEYPEQSVLIVSHGVVIRVIELSLSNRDLKDALKGVPANIEVREVFIF